MPAPRFPTKNTAPRLKRSSSNSATFSQLTRSRNGWFPRGSDAARPRVWTFGGRWPKRVIFGSPCQHVPTDTSPMISTLTEALAERGFDTLTDVQLAVTAPELAEADLLVSAQTGSGKTVGFGLAIAGTLLGEN